MRIACIALFWVRLIFLSIEPEIALFLGYFPIIKWYKIVEEKGLGWIDGLIFMVTEEAKEQLMKEQKING